jgi:signal peptidase I
MCVALFVGWLVLSLQYFDVVSSYWVPSGSMQPTLLVGDFVFAERGPYRNRLPWRGEVVVFLAPDGSDFVKRVVGLPGDSIQVRKGILEVNGVRVTRKRIGDFAVPPGQETLNRAERRYLETLPGGATHPILEESDDDRLDDTEVYTVPPGHVFVMGDNRDNSMDSRVRSVGFVPLDHLLDHPMCIYWSRDRARIGTAIR